MTIHLERRRSARSTLLPWPLGYGQALGLITAAGGFLRILFIARQPLSRDEAFTALVARTPLPDLLNTIGRDSAPPFHYLLEHAVAQASAAPLALRLIPVLAGTALIPLVAAMARRIRGNAGGLWAAAFVAVLPSAVLASRDARAYALGAALVAATTILFWRAAERPRPVRWLAYAAALTVAFWTVYFVALAVPALLIAAAWRLRPAKRTLVTASATSAIALLSLVPWLVFARAQFEHVGVPFWVEGPTPPVILGSLVQLWSGPPVDAEIPFQLVLVGLQGLAILGGMVAFSVLWLGRDRLAGSGRRAAMFCAMAGTIGPLALVAISVGRPLFEARYAGVLWVPLLALAGVGLALASRRTAGLLLVGLALPSLALSAALTRPDTDALLPAIEARLGEHDIIDAYPTQYLLLLEEGNPRLLERLHVVSDDVPWFWGTAAYPPGAILSEVPADVVRAGGRVLYVSEPDDPGPRLPAGYTARDRICSLGVCLAVYESGP